MKWWEWLIVGYVALWLIEQLNKQQQQPQAPLIDGTPLQLPIAHEQDPLAPQGPILILGDPTVAGGGGGGGAAPGGGGSIGGGGPRGSGSGTGHAFSPL